MEDQCSHRVFLEGKCMTCKKRHIDCKDVTTIPVNYIHPGVNMSLTISAVDQFRDQDLRVTIARKKLHLILDLDNTLLNSKKTQNLTVEDEQHVISNPKEIYKVQGGSRWVKLRPGARDFLKKARDMFELSIYTMGTRGYAHRMANLLAVGLDQDGRSLFGKIISKEDCSKVGQKGLDIVLSSKRIVLIVDDLEEVWEDSCKGNVVKIDPYCFFQEEKIEKNVNDDDYALEEDEMDSGLKRVLSTLSLVHSMFYDDNYGDRDYMKRDVRRVLEMVRDDEEPEEIDDEKITLGKRLRETNARLFIERFCAPITKRCKSDATMTATSPCLV